MHPREQAAIAGKLTYDASACKRCGGTLRHTTNADCVDCSRERAREGVKKRRAQIKAMLNKAI
jgi:uncharacterized OB-fold protein